MCDAQQERKNKSSLGTGGEREASRLKINAVKNVCKETSGCREVFRVQDFKATREQDSRWKVRVATYTQYLYFILYRNKFAQSFFELLCVSIKTEPVL